MSDPGNWLTVCKSLQSLITSFFFSASSARLAENMFGQLALCNVNRQNCTTCTSTSRENVDWFLAEFVTGYSLEAPILNNITHRSSPLALMFVYATTAEFLSGDDWPVFFAYVSAFLNAHSAVVCFASPRSDVLWPTGSVPDEGDGKYVVISRVMALSVLMSLQNSASEI